MTDNEAIVATIKGGAGFEVPWLVFRGADPEAVKANIGEAFALSDEQTEGQTLASVVLSASQAFQGEATAQGAFSGKTLGTSSKRKRAGKVQGKGWGDSPKDDPEDPPAAAETDPTAGIREQIENASSVDSLKRVWLRNKAAFNGNSELMDAYKAKGASLKAA